MEHVTKYIFSINTGRSGSAYLKTIFDNVADCQSLHEPAPVGNGAVMRKYANGNREPMRPIAQQKAEIAQNVARNGEVYFESNHCFIKGFGWFLPELLGEENIGVIVLKRDETKIAWSYLRIGCSPLIRKGRKWLYTPWQKNPKITPPTLRASTRITYFAACVVKFICWFARRIFKIPLQDPQWLTNYEVACLKWYVKETEAQMKEFKKQFPRIKYYEVDIKDLNSLVKVQKLLDFFGCQGKDSLAEVVGVKRNIKKTKFKIKDEL